MGMKVRERRAREKPIGIWSLKGLIQSSDNWVGGGGGARRTRLTRKKKKM
jgi:hypothetical protein